MKIQDFIQKNRQTWLDLEQSLLLFEKGSGNAVPKTHFRTFLTQYRKTISDLSILRSNAPGDPLIERLNNLIVRALSIISSQPLNDRERIKYFWAETVPKLLLAQRNHFLLALAVFSAAILFGFGLTYLDGYTANAIIGDDYIGMTMMNIEKGDPFAVYKSGFQHIMSSYIMANNIKVAFFAFASGILYGVGTLYVLMFNGLMFGSITAFFFQQKLGIDFLSTVMIHGTLELFAIVTAGAAGIRFGQSIFRPGRMSRKEALYAFGQEAFQLAVLMVPVLVIAGTLEGYVTRLDLTMAERLSIIGASLAFLLFYLGTPIYFYKRRKLKIEESEKTVIMKF